MTDETEHAAPPQVQKTAPTSDTGAATRASTGEVLDNKSDAPIPDLGVLSRVKVSLTVEVGKAKITLGDLLRLGEGSVLELERLAGDPLEVLANGLPIAKGEVVVVGENYGVRLGEIVEARSRVENV